ncbi:MAG: D-arginine dehydrogenase [Planctomycetota bacterium]|jgi:D-arginine dehydrogenase
MTGTSILIVGGGVAGAATAWSLGRLGAQNVTLLEREPILGTQSSGLNAAILRTVSGSPALTQISERGAAFLAAPPKDFSPVPLVHECGLLLTADAGASDELLRNFEAASSSSSGERLSHGQVTSLFPQLDLEFEVALWFPREGRIDIAALMAGFERGARQAGVAIEAGVKVDSLLVENQTVVGVRLSDGSERRASTTVLAAGGWAGALGQSAGSDVFLEPRRRHLMVTTPSTDIDANAPVLWHHGQTPFYTRPESGGVLFCACDEFVVDPDHCRTDPAVRDLLAERASEHLPGIAGAGMSSFWAGMRTFTHDGQFAIGPDPKLRGLFWVAGLGGHGMVCSAPAGELAARALFRIDDQDPLRSAFAPKAAKNGKPPLSALKKAHSERPPREEQVPL